MKLWPVEHFIFPHFWAWLLYSAITPKSEDKYVVKVFNWSEFYLSEMTLLQNPYFNTSHTLQNPLLNRYLSSFCYLSPNMPVLPMSLMVLVPIQTQLPVRLVLCLDIRTVHVWRMELNLDWMNFCFGSPYPCPFFKAHLGLIYVELTDSHLQIQ